MFFFLSKVFGFFATPSNLCAGIGIVGVLLLRSPWPRTGTGLLITSIVLIAVLGLWPIGNALILPLEERFPPHKAGRAEPVGIIILGGALDTVISRARSEVALNEAAERMTAAAGLALQYPRARVLFTGGSGNLLLEGASEAELAGRLFHSFGIATDRVMLEDKSRDTAENARFSAALAQPQRGDPWLLVTSAHHMPRAVGAFRKAGFSVEAYPVDYRTRGWGDLARPFQTVADGLRRTDVAVREWVGLFAYWLVGRTDALFPCPEG